MRRCTQFLPLSSSQYHFSEEILHTPLSTWRGRAGRGKGFFMLVRLHCSFPGSPFRSVHFGVWMRNLQEWTRYLHLSRANLSLGVFWAGIHHTLGKRGSNFLPCLPQLTFSPAVLFPYRSSPSLVWTVSNHHQVPVCLFPSCSSSKSMRLSPTHSFNYLFLSSSLWPTGRPTSSRNNCTDSQEIVPVFQTVSSVVFA